MIGRKKSWTNNDEGRKKKTNDQIIETKSCSVFKDIKFSAFCWNCPAEEKKEKRHNLDAMLMRGEGNVEGEDRNKPNSHLMTSLSIILNPFTVPRCKNRISPDRKDLMAVSGLRARDHHFLLRQISSATCPHKALSKRIKSFKHKIRLEKDTWQIFMAFILSSPQREKKKNPAGQMMWPSWDRLSTVSLGWPCKKQTGSTVAALVFPVRKREKRALLFLLIKRYFAFHLQRQFKSPTNMQIHYRQQIHTEVWAILVQSIRRRVSADGRMRPHQRPPALLWILRRQIVCIYQIINMLYVFIQHLKPYRRYLL